MDWFKKAPTPVVVAVIVVCGVGFLGVLGAYVLLSLQGVDTTEFRQWVNTLGQILIFPFMGVSTIAAVSAAKAASNAEDNTNGHLTEKEQQITKLRADLRLARDERPY